MQRILCVTLLHGCISPDGPSLHEIMFIAAIAARRRVAHCARHVPLAAAALTAADAARIDIGAFVRGYEGDFDGTGSSPPWVEATIASVAFGLHVRVSPTVALTAAAVPLPAAGPGGRLR